MSENKIHIRDAWICTLTGSCAEYQGKRQVRPLTVGRGQANMTLREPVLLPQSGQDCCPGLRSWRATVTLFLVDTGITQMGTCSVALKKTQGWPSPPGPAPRHVTWPVATLSRRKSLLFLKFLSATIKSLSMLVLICLFFTSMQMESK